MIPYFLARSRKLDFYFSFSSWFSRFFETFSIFSSRFMRFFNPFSFSFQCSRFWEKFLLLFSISEIPKNKIFKLNIFFLSISEISPPVSITLKDDRITKTWILPVFLPKKRPSFAHIFTKICLYEELGTLISPLKTWEKNIHFSFSSRKRRTFLQISLSLLETGIRDFRFLFSKFEIF